jgi:hypothetical protein
MWAGIVLIGDLDIRMDITTILTGTGLSYMILTIFGIPDTMLFLTMRDIVTVDFSTTHTGTTDLW